MKFVVYNSDVIFRVWRQTFNTGIEQLDKIPDFLFQDFKKNENK